MTRFRNKYRIETARLRAWDYTAAAWYFVTLCTKHRQHFFGTIVAGQLALSPMGMIVDEEWQRTVALRADVKLDEWVIMPNHLHGIIIIEPADSGMPVGLAAAERRHETPRLASGSLGAIVGQVKSVCTKRIRAGGYPQFDWQSRFHDHILRSQAELDQIRTYILQNPAKWELDTYYGAP